MVRDAEFLEHCRAQLPERQAEAWRLHVEQGLGFAELAERLGCSESAARGRVFRACQRLVEAGELRPPGERGGKS